MWKCAQLRLETSEKANYVHAQLQIYIMFSRVGSPGPNTYWLKLWCTSQSILFSPRAWSRTKLLMRTIGIRIHIFKKAAFSLAAAVRLGRTSSSLSNLISWMIHWVKTQTEYQCWHDVMLPEEVFGGAYSVGTSVVMLEGWCRCPAKWVLSTRSMWPHGLCRDRRSGTPQAKRSASGRLHSKHGNWFSPCVALYDAGICILYCSPLLLIIHSRLYINYLTISNLAGIFWKQPHGALNISQAYMARTACCSYIWSVWSF